MSSVHRSPRTSAARETGQYWLYFCMAHPGTRESTMPVQKVNRISPMVELAQAFLLPVRLSHAIPSRLLKRDLRGSVEGARMAMQIGKLLASAVIGLAVMADVGIVRSIAKA